MLTEEQKQVGSEIIRQLGGNRFIAMTGAKNFVIDDKKCVTFNIGRNSKHVNHVKITLNWMDLYDVDFIWANVKGLKTVSSASGIYNDQLQDVFTSNTGLYTHL